VGSRSKGRLRATKSLSVNSNNSPPATNRSSERDKSLVAFSQLLISDEELLESVEPKGTLRLRYSHDGMKDGKKVLE
jgi:hypothetical protein